MIDPREKQKPQKIRSIKLGQVISIISGAPFKSELFNGIGNGLPLIRVRDVNTGPAGVFYSGEFSKEHLVATGDLLVSMDGDFKAIKWIHGYGLLNQRVCKVVPEEKVLNKHYLEQFLPKALSDIHRETTFTTVKHLSTKSIRDIEIPLPSLEDQTRIAHLLGKVEELIAQRKQHLQQLDDLLKSVFLEMFGDPVRNEKEWDIVGINTVCHDIFLGLTNKVDYVETGGYPLIRATDIKDGKLSFENARYISAAQHKKITKNRISKRGDILVSKSGTLGTTAIVDSDEEFTTYESIITIQINPKKLVNHYLNALLKNQNFQIKMLGGKTGGTVGHLNLLMFREITLPAPAIGLQNKFATIVEKVEILKSRYQQSLADLEALYGALSQQAFKGELDLSRVRLD